MNKATITSSLRFPAHGITLALIMALYLTGCVSQRSEDTQAIIARGVTMPLVLPGNTTSITQKITGQYSNNTHVLIMQVEASPEAVVMVGMAPTGTQLFNLHFDGNRIQSWQSPLFIVPFDARYVLADYQLATLTAGELRTLLPRDTTVQEQQDDKGRTRRIVNSKDDTVIEIHYRSAITHYCHRERHYCLLIETLE